MKRRAFIAGVVAFLASVGKTLANYVDPPGWHRHQCPKCSFIWTHQTGSHQCAQCGTSQYYWYQGPLAPSNSVKPAVVKQPVVAVKTQVPPPITKWEE